jgi:hypothetical protein
VEREVEIFASLQCLVIGPSNIAQPRAWVEMFLWLQSRGRAGMFVYGLFNLGCGSIIVGFHYVWTGPAAVVTVFGWGLVLYKGLFTLLVPPAQPVGVGAEAAARTRLAGCVGGRVPGCPELSVLVRRVHALTKPTVK